MIRDLRVLLVDDSPTDAKLVIQELRRAQPRLYFERVDTAADMRSALTLKEWDLVLSDWSMPKFSAGAALAILKETGLDLPFIMVSGTIGEDIAVEAMRTGAHDYVLKDKLGRLIPAIERALRDSGERAARRSAEAALAESERRFRRLRESGIIGITISNLNGSILDANDAYLNMLGYSLPEVQQGAVSWTDLTTPEFAELDARAADQLREAGVAPAWETELFRKDGSRVPLMVGMAMLDYPKTIAFTADLTERRQAELGREAAELKLRQSEEQLRQSQKMEAMGRLAGGVAHDFNNILSVILGHAELLLDELKATEPFRNDVQQIYDAAGRAAGLTRQLLLFSRQQVAETRVVALREVLTSMDNMLQRIVGEEVELVLLLATTEGRVSVNPSHIEQVVLNLVVNARDAMTTGGKLTIELSDVDLEEMQSQLPAKAGPHVRLAVSDTGAGMDRATQARIFEPFFTTKELGRGTGLGLSTVFGIVQQSGGSIRVSSQLGQGTTFEVYLPKAEGDVEVPRATVPPSTLRGTETVLLVEDEEHVRTVVLNALQRQGYRVLVASCAADALQLAASESATIDVLLSDVVMPYMRDPELAKRLLQRYPKLRVILMSGYTNEGAEHQTALGPGMAFLQKPFTPTTLATKLREVLAPDRPD